MYGEGQILSESSGVFRIVGIVGVVVVRVGVVVRVE